MAKASEDSSLDSGHFAGEARSPTCPPSGAQRRGSWWQYNGSSYSRNGSLDNVSSSPEDTAADASSRCPCSPESEDFPWTDWESRDVVRKASPRGFTPEAVRRSSALLRRASVRVCREAQRSSELHRRCTCSEVQSALRVVSSWGSADKCVSSAVRAVSSLWMNSGDAARPRGTSACCGLTLSVGRFFRWMVETRVAVRVHEYAAVCSAASMESLAEEVARRVSHSARLTGGRADGVTCCPVSVESMEGTSNTDPESWGLSQPYEHSMCGKNANGESSSTASVSPYTKVPEESSKSMEDTCIQSESKALEQSSLNTCVSSIVELSDLVSRLTRHMHHSRSSSPSVSGVHSAHQPAVSWDPAALRSSYYFSSNPDMEPSENSNMEPPAVMSSRERSFSLSPPLMEWIRVAVVHAEYRRSLLVDCDDVRQTARLLLPGLDCEPRQSRSECCFQSFKCLDAAAASRKFQSDLGFRMLSCGRADSVQQAAELSGAEGINTMDDQGMTPSMYAAAAGDEAMVQMLIEVGAQSNSQIPSYSARHPSVHPGSRHWVASTFAVSHGHLCVAQLLSDAGADVEGGVSSDREESCAETPSQLAAAAGNYEMVSLLLTHGADPSSKSQHGTSLTPPSFEEMNCFSYAAAHGHRNILRRSSLQPPPRKENISSLEEISAEGVEEREGSTHPPAISSTIPFSSKTTMKASQQALYYSAEHGYSDVTMELREMGVQWRSHTWLESVRRAQQSGRSQLTIRLSSDFPSIRTEDFSPESLSVGIPLSFRMSETSREYKVKQCSASVISHCYGCFPIPAVPPMDVASSTQLDVWFLNNKQMSDTTFMVEGRPFFAHRVSSVSASERFRQMLADSPDNIIHISHITYSTFQMMMRSLYCGGTKGMKISPSEAMKSSPVAFFFQLRGSQRCCEATLSTSSTIDTAVSVYRTSKRYGAAELCRFCEGFFLQNMDRFSDREDFRRSLLHRFNEGSPSGLDPDPSILKNSEVTSINRLYNLHAACRG